MDWENFFYITQGLYAVLAMILVVIVIVSLFFFFRKLAKLEKKMETLADKTIQTAEITKSLIDKTEKVAMYGLYRLLKSISGKRDKN